MTPSAFASFERGQDPLLMAYLSALQGFTPPSLEEAFSYIEWGCEEGYRLELLAAAYPHAHFYGVDPDKEKIEAAKERQKGSSLPHLNFYTCSWEEIPHLSLPSCTYMSLPRQWSWASPTALESLLEAIDQTLAPNGLLFLTYEALPGASLLQELRYFLLSLISQLEGSPEERLTQALSYLGVLKQKEAPFFKAFPEAGELLEEWLRAPLSFLLKEVAHPPLRAYHFQEVYEIFQKKSLEFVGRLPFFLNFLAVATPPPLYGLLRQIQDRPTLECHKNFINPFYENQEVYQRQPSPSLPAQAQIDSFYFSTFYKKEGVTRQPTLSLPRPLKQISFDFTAPKYEEILTHLSQRGISLKELKEEKTEQDPTILLNGLLMGQQVLPLLSAGEACPPFPPSFRIHFSCPLNERNLKEFFEKEEAAYLPLASPRAGCQVFLPKEIAFLLWAFHEGGNQKALSWIQDYRNQHAPFPSWMPAPGQTASLLEMTQELLLPKLQEFQIIEIL